MTDSTRIGDLRRKYNHPAEVRAQRCEARRGLNVAESMLLAHCPPPSQTGLVLGCGAGREVAALAAAGWQVTGADLAEAPLAAARGMLRRRGLAAELVLLKRPFPLPFAPSSFGAVFLLAQLIEHLTLRAERLTLLREAARVLSPQGVAYFGTHDVRPGDYAELADLAAGGGQPADIMAEKISGGRSPGGIRLHLYRREELLCDLAEAGLQPLLWLAHEAPGPGHPVWRRFLYLAAAADSRRDVVAPR